jgi:hypothetical protein
MARRCGASVIRPTRSDTAETTFAVSASLGEMIMSHTQEDVVGYLASKALVQIN